MKNLLYMALSGSDLKIPKISADQAHLNVIVTAVLGGAGIAAVVVIILGGIRYILSAGDASQVKKAKDMITYAIIGMIVTAIAFVIVQVVVYVINQ